ncbi:hypothetical protein [Mycolicibacterium anyangense]|uniref:hypothetical protein n=1 Tax=Mycolicibacterium anyangense TaxID=1431246 RepID=UPI0013D26FDD|nr:hypothetical protein [Mycolicibacterium anyangense]
MARPSAATVEPWRTRRTRRATSASPTTRVAARSGPSPASVVAAGATATMGSATASPAAMATRCVRDLGWWAERLGILAWADMDSALAQHAQRAGRHASA